jgi:hypothetical protein
MLKENEGQEQNCVGLTVQREARCTNDLLGFSDSKLLCFAAASMGCEYDNFSKSITADKGFTFEEWNPLENDEDAFSLIVLFAMSVIVDFAQVKATAYCKNSFLKSDCIKLEGTNTRELTRKAIVMAVADISRART